MDSSTGDDRSNDRLTQAILALLDRQGVDVRKRIGTLEFAANLTYQQVRRKLLGEASWLVDDLQNIAAAFDEPSLLLIEPPPTKARFEMGQCEVRCLIWLDEDGSNNELGPLWAKPGKEGERWSVVHAAQRDAAQRLDGKWRRVKRMLFEPPSPARVAFLSDDKDLARVRLLRTEGLDVHPFSALPRFRAALESGKFSVVVCPWRLDGQVVGPSLVDFVRKQSEKLPLIVLVEQPDFVGPAALEIHQALSRAQAVIYMTSVDARTLFSAISSSLGQA